MAIIRGKRIYDSRRVAALAQLEDRAAAEYVYLLSGLADDWGRFQAIPRRILGTAYAGRPDVSEADVERWLELFASVRVEGSDEGLVQFYEVDGVRYGEWTNWMGDPPSQRRYHSCPEPPWSDHEHGSTCKRWGAARGTPTGTRRGTPKVHLQAYPSVPSVPIRTTPPPTPPSPSEGGADVDEQPRLRIAARARKTRRRADSGELEAYAAQLGLHTDPELRKRIREALRSGSAPEAVRGELDELAGKAPPGAPRGAQARSPDPPASQVVAVQVWADALRRLEATVDRHLFATLLKPTDGWGLDGGCLTVAVPSGGLRDRLAGSLKLGPEALRAAHKACVDVCRVEFLVVEQAIA